VARLKISVGENSWAINFIGCDYISVALTPVSGSSVPKHRW
jgi:hypothetical protein